VRILRSDGLLLILRLNLRLMTRISRGYVLRTPAGGLTVQARRITAASCCCLDAIRSRIRMRRCGCPLTCIPWLLLVLLLLLLRRLLMVFKKNGISRLPQQGEMLDKGALQRQDADRNRRRTHHTYCRLLTSGDIDKDMTIV